ncbi:MAG: peptidoglycan binding protein CsiV [Litorivicinaceae bacterium]|nr:peptidoglycan binding protein CsiV [Litorivicinaceae bacterium]
MKRWRWLVVGVLGLSLHSQAQTPRHYALEVLIFSRPNLVSLQDEAWPSEAPAVPMSLNLVSAARSGYDNLVLLPARRRTLSDAAYQIRMRMNGSILFHERWIHPLTPNQATNPWLRVEGEGRDGGRLSGFLRWSIDRFIEVDADLRLAFTDPLTQEQRVFQITEFRKLSSKDIHYLDHPAFGMIIQADPIEGPDG